MFRGIQGNTGLQGVQGIQGNQGIQGQTGLRGSTGYGLQGQTGLQGIQGVTGLIGVTGLQGITGIKGGRIFVYYADQVDSPNNSDWVINNNAPASSDTLKNALIVRRFDDTTEEGIGFITNIPLGITDINFYFKWRAQTAPASAKTVVLRLYNRQIPDNSVVTEWSSALQLTSLNVQTNTNFQYDSQLISLSSLGITAGRTVQFELTRYGGNVLDTLSGDFILLELMLEVI